MMWNPQLYALVSALMLGAGMSISPVVAQTEDPKAGLRLWINGSCANCHGRNGQGGAVSADFPNGPSLRTSTLDDTALRDVISCGVPGTKMHGWLIGAYVDQPCGDTPLGTLPQDAVVVPVFSQDEIDVLTRYIQRKFMGLEGS